MIRVAPRLASVTCTLSPNEAVGPSRQRSASRTTTRVRRECGDLGEEAKVPHVLKKGSHGGNMVFRREREPKASAAHTSLRAAAPRTAPPSVSST